MKAACLFHVFDAAGVGAQFHARRRNHQAIVLGFRLRHRGDDPSNEFRGRVEIDDAFVAVEHYGIAAPDIAHDTVDPAYGGDTQRPGDNGRMGGHSAVFGHDAAHFFEVHVHHHVGGQFLGDYHAVGTAAAMLLPFAQEPRLRLVHIVK